MITLPQTQQGSKGVLHRSETFGVEGTVAPARMQQGSKGSRGVPHGSEAPGVQRMVAMPTPVTQQGSGVLDSIEDQAFFIAAMFCSYLENIMNSANQDIVTFFPFPCFILRGAVS